MTLNRMLFASSAIIGAFLSSAAQADLAGNLSTKSARSYLMFVQDGSVHRLECDDQSTLRDHDHCKEHAAAIPADIFFAKLPLQFGRHLAEFETQAQEAWIKMKQIDGRLMAMARAALPDEPPAVSVEQIDSATRAVEQQALKIANLRDQIGRLEFKLGQHLGEADDIEQLAIDRSQLLQFEKEASSLAENLLSLRASYIRQRVDATDANAHDLLAMKERLRAVYATAKNLSAREMTDMVCAELMAVRLRDEGFAWEASCNLQTSVPDRLRSSTWLAIALAFEEIEEPTRVFSASSTTRHLSMTIPRAGLVGSVSCQYSTGLIGLSLFNGRFFVRGPGGLFAGVQIAGTDYYVGVEWTTDSRSIMGNPPEGNANFANREAQGDWTFEYEPARDTRDFESEQLQCTVTLRL